MPGGYSEARARATAKYKKANYKRIPLDVPKTDAEAWKAAADAAGETMNTYIKKSVWDRINRGNCESGDGES